jgi:hypothetical protein
LPEERSQMHVYLLLFFLLSRGDCIDLEYCKRSYWMKIKTSSALLKWSKKLDGNYQAPSPNPLLCFLFSVSILHVERLRKIVQGKFSLGLNCIEDISGRGGGFSVDVGPDFLELFKKWIKIKIKAKKFFQLKVRSNIKTYKHKLLCI